MHALAKPPAPSPEPEAITTDQRRYLTRAVDVFSVVHMNLHASNLAPYGTLFFDDGADCSLELSLCLNIHCILRDLRERIIPENPPCAIVIFLPGLVDMNAATRDCAIYIEVLGSPGVVLSTNMSSVQTSSLQQVAQVEMTLSPGGIRIPPNLLERAIRAVKENLDLDTRIVGPMEVSAVLDGLNCACENGMHN